MIPPFTPIQRAVSSTLRLAAPTQRELDAIHRGCSALQDVRGEVDTSTPGGVEKHDELSRDIDALLMFTGRVNDFRGVAETLLWQ